MRTTTVPNEVLLPEVAKLLDEGRKVTIKAKGNSMLPFIIGGRDKVVLQKNEEYGKGDAVLAEIAPETFVLHRIIKIDGEKVILMGDGNLIGTEQCSIENICGQVVAIVRNGRQRKVKYRHIWQTLLPIRRYLLAIYRRIK